MLTVGLIGLGLTGSAIARYLLEGRNDVQIVMAGAGPHSAKAGKDLGALLGLRDTGMAVVAAEAIPDMLLQTRPQAVIDFSHPDATVALLRHYAQARRGVVVGTTGFTDSQLHQLRNAAGTQRRGLMYAPNITRGVTVLMMIAKLATSYLPGYDIEVIERHHRRKKDAPSGTAAKIAGQLLGERGAHGEAVHGRHGAQARTDDEVGVHAVRAGGIIGVHEVLFASEFDEITITHRSESRQAFAAGAVEAAAWICQRRGFFTVEDMIMNKDVMDLVHEDVAVPPALTPSFPLKTAMG